MDQENRYQLFQDNDLVMFKYGNGYLTYKVTRVTTPVGNPPWQHNQGHAELILSRDGMPAKKWRGRSSTRVLYSYQLGTKTGARAIKIEDFIEDCRKNVEVYTRVFNQHYS